ncbi:hypothetical protein ACFFJN_08315 [Erwinia mallotivora]|uniref:hypothetical protein n=1 Tax=Erwinia mallotivora TaxID=69222 RepID=UPI0035E8FCDF
MTKELSRLSNENAVLRTELDGLRKAASEHSDAVTRVVKIMDANKRKIKVRATAKWDEAKKFNTTLLKIFLIAARNLINENSSDEISGNIALHYHGKGYYKNRPTGKNIITDLIADRVALDIAEPSRKKHSVNDKITYWSLTDTGKQVLKRAHRIQPEEGMIPESDPQKDQS